MAENPLARLQKEVNFKKFQLAAIYEFTAAIHTSYDIDHIMRIFFSTLMGPLGISKVVFFHKSWGLLRKRGVMFSEAELKIVRKCGQKVFTSNNTIRVEEIPTEAAPVRELLQRKEIAYLLNLSLRGKTIILLGLGTKLNSRPLAAEDLEFAYFLGCFMQMALENVRYLEQMVEKKKIEAELSIAREIQRALLPQTIPPLKHFEIAVHYEPINEVGGDYYDILKKRNHLQPIILADVEGKGLSAALLAASSQAVFHTLNDLYHFDPAKFVGKANSMIVEFTRGKRFITLFWMLLDDNQPALTYVNAGHVDPFLIAADGVRRLNKGGFLTGFMENVPYEQETLPLRSGDMIVVFTDGVHEVQNPEGDEFGENAVVEFIRENKQLSCEEILEKLYKKVKSFSKNRKFRDDFTIILIKVK